MPHTHTVVIAVLERELAKLLVAWCGHCGAPKPAEHRAHLARGELTHAGTGLTMCGATTEGTLRSARRTVL